MVIRAAQQGAIGSAFGVQSKAQRRTHRGVNQNTFRGANRWPAGMHSGATRRVTESANQRAKASINTCIRRLQAPRNRGPSGRAIRVRSGAHHGGQWVSILKCQGGAFRAAIERTKGGSAVHKTGVRWTAYSGEARLKTGVLGSRISEDFLDSLVD